MKGNSSLRLGVVTGVMQIATGSMFGMNNPRMNNIIWTRLATWTFQQPGTSLISAISFLIESLQNRHRPPVDP